MPRSISVYYAILILVCAITLSTEIYAFGVDLLESVPHLLYSKSLLCLLSFARSVTIITALAIVIARVWTDHEYTNDSHRQTAINEPASSDRSANAALDPPTKVEASTTTTQVHVLNFDPPTNSVLVISVPNSVVMADLLEDLGKTEQAEVQEESGYSQEQEQQVLEINEGQQDGRHLETGKKEEAKTLEEPGREQEEQESLVKQAIGDAVQGSMQLDLGMGVISDETSEEQLE